MHFEIVFSTVAASAAYVVVLHCCTAPETMWKMNFHIFLLLGKKKENASFFLCVMCVCRRQAVRRDAATSFNTLPQPAALEAQDCCKGEGVPCTLYWSQLQTMPQSNIASFWSGENPFCLLRVASRSRFSFLLKMHAAMQAGRGEGRGSVSLRWQQALLVGVGFLSFFFFWLNATRNYDTFNYQASE